MAHDVSRDLLNRFRPWLADRREERRRFFIVGLVIIDANILLNLYRFTPLARDQVLSALERVAEEGRLWLPHHAVLEFVRGRTSAVEGRNRRLRDTLVEVGRRFDRAVSEVVSARRLVQHLIKDTERDPLALQDLEELITDSAVADALKVWKTELTSRVRALQEVHDIDPDNVREGDPLLARINQLLAERIGNPLPQQDVADLVRHFVEYRSPNHIPPGFKDADSKDTHLLSAGDYLLWEQIVRHVELEPPLSQLLLLVTDDQKADWRGRDRQVRPELADEIWVRAAVLLRLETTEDFLQGVEQFLGVSLSKDTYAEVARVTVAEEPEDVAATEPASAEVTQPIDESRPLPEVINEENVQTVDPGQLAVDALRTSQLVTPDVKEVLREDRFFAWWLVGATATLQLRRRSASEPAVCIYAASTDADPPGLGWERERLRVGTGIRNVWVAPWLAQLLRSLPAPDPNHLRRMAGRQLTIELDRRPPQDSEPDITSC